MNKMTRSIATLALGMIALFPLQSMAEQKIGVVNGAQILASSTQAKAAVEKMKSEFKPREEKILGLEKDLKEKAEKFQRNSAVMNDAEKGKLEKDILAKRRELQSLQEAFREDYTLRYQEELKKINEKVRAAIEEIAKKDKYDIILQSDNLPFATKQIDITDKVIKAVG